MQMYKEYKRDQRIDRDSWPEPPCASTPRLWFDSKRSDEATRRCLKDCPVVMQCLAFAITHGESVGVWGGMTEKELLTWQKRFSRGFHRKTWNHERSQAFESWVRKAVQDKQAKAVGVVSSKRRR